MIGKPIVLSSEYSINGGGIVANNPERLFCPNPVLVDSIRFDFNDYGPHEISLKTGRAIITEGPQVWSAMMAMIEAYGYGRATPVVTNIGATTWKFSRPMYLPRQKQVNFQGRMAVGSALNRAFFSVHGRALPEGYRPPATVAVPYVGVFRPLSGTNLTAVDTSDPQKSTSEFRNPFPSVFHITKMVGNSTGPINGLGLNMDDVLWSATSDCPAEFSLARHIAKIRISDGNGNPMVRDWTPLLNLCQGIRNEWRVAFDLQPGQMLQAYMDLRHAQVGAPGQAFAYPSIALVGWREVPLKEVYG